MSHQNSDAELARKVTHVVTGLVPQKVNEILPFLRRSLSLRFGGELDSELDYFTSEQFHHQKMARLRDLFGGTLQSAYFCFACTCMIMTP